MENSISKQAYPHQVICAKEIVNMINKGIKNILVCSPPQVGKTGTMGEVIAILENQKRVEYKNVFLITNFDDKEWSKTMSDRFPAPIFRNTHRRSAFDTMVNKFKKIDKKVLKIILIDEPQYGAGNNQSIEYLLQKLSLKSLEEIYKHNTIFLQISATFDKSAIEAASKCEKFSHILYLHPPPEYKGIENLNIADYNNKEDIQTFHSEVKKFEKPKYHLVRVRKKRKRCKKCKNVIIGCSPNCSDKCGKCGECGECDKCLYINKDCQYMIHYNGPEYNYIHVGSSKSDDISSEQLSILLNKDTPPERHTIVYIKECYRASNTLSKQHIGNMYEYIPKKVVGSTIIQSLAGRACGYDNEAFVTGYSKIRTDKSICENYSNGIGDYVNLLKVGEFTTRIRDKYNQESFNSFNKLKLETCNVEVKCDEIFDDGFNIIKNMGKRSSKKFIEETISSYFRKHIQQNTDIVRKLKTKYNIRDRLPLLSIKQGKKELIVTSLNKIDASINKWCFHCIPVYENRSPDSSFVFVFIF